MSTTTRIPSTYQMPQEHVVTLADGRRVSVVDAVSMKQILFTIYNQINNPPVASTTTSTPASNTTSAVQYADGVTPVDNGDHQNFHLPQSPNPSGSLQFQVNGVTQTGYTLRGNLVTLSAAIVGAFKAQVWYRY